MNTAYLKKLYALRTRIRSSDAVIRFYTIGTLFLFGSVILFFMRSFGIFESSILENIFILIFLISTIIGFAREVLQLFLRMWSNSAGKVTIGIFWTSLVQLIRVVARLQINGITGLSPEYFGATLNYITIIISPLIILAATLTAISSYFIFLYSIMVLKSILDLSILMSIDAIYTTFKASIYQLLEHKIWFKYLFSFEEPTFETRIKLKLPSIKIFGRLLGSLVCVVVTCVCLFGYVVNENRWVFLEKNIIVQVEYFRVGYCENVISNELSIPLKGESISVATRTDAGWKFEHRECDVAIEPQISNVRKPLEDITEYLVSALFSFFIQFIQRQII